MRNCTEMYVLHGRSKPGALEGAQSKTIGFTAESRAKRRAFGTLRLEQGQSRVADRLFSQMNHNILLDMSVQTTEHVTVLPPPLLRLALPSSKSTRNVAHPGHHFNLIASQELDRERGAGATNPMCSRGSGPGQTMSEMGYMTDPRVSFTGKLQD